MCVSVAESRWLSARRYPDFTDHRTTSALHSLDFNIQAVRIREKWFTDVRWVHVFQHCRSFCFSTFYTSINSLFSFFLTSSFWKNYGFKPNLDEVKMQRNSPDFEFKGPCKLEFLIVDKNIKDTSQQNSTSAWIEPSKCSPAGYMLQNHRFYCRDMKLKCIILSCT